MVYRFTEVLNDLINYFILGDILLLEQWKNKKSLPDDLAAEFTRNENGDHAVIDGIILPMTGIENYPYTIIFNLSDDTPELLKEKSRLQHRRSGYSLRISNNILMLYTWRILEQFTPERVHTLLEYYKQHERPLIELENGWYSVEVLGGEILVDSHYEPAFEFILRKTNNSQSASEVDVSYPFTIESAIY